jgi:hypothetical protein
MEPSLWQTLGQLFAVLGQLAVQLLELGAHWLLLIFWVAWWLCAVNWQKLWPFLARGGWAPLVLLILMVSFAWSIIQPTPPEFLDGIPTFWWQLGYVSVLVGLALFCGWLQGLLGWTPAEIDLEPPVHDEAGGHTHAAHH